MPPRILLRSLLLLPVFAMSCNGMMPGAREDILRVAREFNEDLHWARHEQVLPRLSPESRARYAERLMVLGEDIEIADIEVIGVEMQNKGDRAVCRVQMDWADRRTGTMQRTMVFQTWEDRRVHGWVVTGQVRGRGAPFSLVDEPPPPKPAAPAGADGAPKGASPPPSK